MHAPTTPGVHSICISRVCLPVYQFVFICAFLFYQCATAIDSTVDFLSTTRALDIAVATRDATSNGGS